MRHIQRHIANLLKARFPFIYLTTWEEQRAALSIHHICKDRELIKTPRHILTWKLTTGMVNEANEVQKQTQDPLQALEFVQNYEEPAVFIFKDFHIFFQEQGRMMSERQYRLIRKIRDMIPEVKQSFNPKNIIFVSPTLKIPDDLLKAITIVDFPLPTFDEIKQVLLDMIEINKVSGRIEMDLTDEAIEQLSRAALGLTLQEAENAFARAMVEDGKLHIADLPTILEEKKQIVKKMEILEYVEPGLSLADVGGLENLKRWLLKRNKSWLQEAKKYRLPSPKGVLITGVPGCGKSLMAKAVSVMWQLPLLRMDIGKIYSGIVGSSEENMRKAIKIAEAVSPSILWVDEIEKGFSGVVSNYDSGTSSRIFGTFLTWMQEKEKPVFVVATANNISELPPELMRKGRFDEIFFVDLPTFHERKDIFMLHLEKRLVHEEAKGSFQLDDRVVQHLSDLTEGFSGAEIEQVVIGALFEAFSEQRSLTLEDVEKVIQQTVPLSVTQAEEIRRIREWADVRAVSATKRESSHHHSPTYTARGGRTIDV